MSHNFGGPFDTAQGSQSQYAGQGSQSPVENALDHLLGEGSSVGGEAMVVDFQQNPANEDKGYEFVDVGNNNLLLMVFDSNVEEYLRNKYKIDFQWEFDKTTGLFHHEGLLILWNEKEQRFVQSKHPLDMVRSRLNHYRKKIENQISQIPEYEQKYLCLLTIASIAVQRLQENIKKDVILLLPFSEKNVNYLMNNPQEIEQPGDLQECGNFLEDIREQVVILSEFLQTRLTKDEAKSSSRIQKRGIQIVKKQLQETQNALLGVLDDVLD